MKVLKDLRNALCGPLRAMTAYRQFCVYELRPGRHNPNKTDKVPICPASWGDYDKLLTAEDALTIAEGWQGSYPAGVGFVLRENDPFFFLDMDSYLGPDCQWLPLVGELYAALPGCAFEVSSSGKGVHMFGSLSMDLQHACRNTPLRLELYTRDRFVALTGVNAIGDAARDLTAELAVIVQRYFPKRVGAGAEWGGDGPRADWDGPVDDDDLLGMAIRSKSAASAFGGKATFADLFEARAEALARCYPAEGDSDWNRSSADAALAAHLAFWTGCDADRIERLMRRSALVRDKWEREDYMRSTIGKAIAGCREVFGARQAEPLRPVEWTNTPLVAVPDTREPEQAVNDLLQRGQGYFVEAYAAQDFKRLLWFATKTYPGECDKMLAMLTACGAEDTPALRDAISHANACIVPPIPVQLSAPGELSRAPSAIEGPSVFSCDDQARLFAGCVIVPAQNAVLMPNGDLYGQDSFNTHMPAGVYALSDNSTTDKAWKALVMSRKLRWPRADRVEFRPDLEPGALFTDGGFTVANSYRPYPFEAAEGDASPFLQHLSLMLPDARDRDILLSWMAAFAQYPGRKFRWAPMLQGTEGNGKGLVVSVLRHVAGLGLSHCVQASDIASKFNGWILGKLLVIINEADFGRSREMIDAVKPLISDDEVGVQAKGRDQATGRNFANFFLTTNHLGALGAAVNGRRYSVLATAQQHEDDCLRDGMTGAYFRGLHHWLDNGGRAVVAGFLKTYPINPEFNPAGECIRAPRTSAHAAAVDAGKGAVEQAIEEAIAEGRIGFRGGFVCGAALGALLESARREMSVPKNKRREIMRSLGYDWHPSLPHGRANRVLAVSGGVKPVIFVKVDHPVFQLKNASDVVRKFEESFSAFNTAAA